MENRITMNGADAAAAHRPATARIVTCLAEFPAGTLLDEQALAEVFAVTKRTIARMVCRYELPPPILVAGRATWVSDRVRAHIEARADAAAQRTQEEMRRIEAIKRRATP